MIFSDILEKAHDMQEDGAFYLAISVRGTELGINVCVEHNWCVRVVTLDPVPMFDGEIFDAIQKAVDAGPRVRGFDQHDAAFAKFREVWERCK